MTRFGTRLANELWHVACGPSTGRFLRGIDSLERTQTAALRHYLRVNRDTEFGRRYGFDSVSSPDAYQEKVPISTYESYREWIGAIGEGRQNVLTSEPVTMFEITSGSTSASKLIPVTRSLRSEFQRAISVWIGDLFARLPQLKGGPSYWSVSPLMTGSRVTSGGIPIGFEEDSAYLGRWSKGLADASLAVPNEVKHFSDIESFRYATLLFLLQEPGLRLISVWNPTFLTLLLSCLPEWWESLAEDLSNGSLTPPGAMDPHLRDALEDQLSAYPKRARALALIDPDDYRAIWPQLGLVSCWMDAAAAPFADDLRERLPGVLFQGKGLIATEAFVSVPLIGVDGAVLASTSHFYEFTPIESGSESSGSGRPRLAHQLEVGGNYNVVVTTGGGLYRYDLRDVVEVVGHYGQAPCLRFLGKSDKVSDNFGEKLDERFVGSVLDELFVALSLVPVFAMLAPDVGRGSPRYTLYIELLPGAWTNVNPHRLADRLDQMLRRSFHYDYCRRLEQLGPADVFQIAGNAKKTYLDSCQEKGRRLGDVKPTVLDLTTGWGANFSRLEPSGSLDSDAAGRLVGGT